MRRPSAQTASAPPASAPPARGFRILPAALLASALLTTALLASLPAAAQQVYKWKDAAGVTHVSAEPPPQGQRYEAREVDHHQAAPAPAASEAGDGSKAAGQGEDPACATARANLRILQGTAPVTIDSDGDGKPDRALSDTDRANQRRLAEATIAVKCGGSGAAQPREPEEE